MSAIDIKFVNQRLTSLIHRCLDAELLKTALFYAERLFALDGTNHDSRHLLSKVMLKLDQPHSALHLVTRPQDDPCAGCLFMAAKCNEKLLRPRKAKDLMTAALGIMSVNSERAQGLWPVRVIYTLSLITCCRRGGVPYNDRLP
jgi:anaphase-promoting complex subunit 3